MKTRLEFGFILCLMLFLISSELLAQAPDTLWTRTYGGDEVDAAYGVAPLPSGGFMVGGYTPHDVGLPDDMWYFRVDANGNMVWEDKIGHYDRHERAYTLEPALDGQFILAGELISSDNTMDVYVVKADSNGNGWGFGYVTHNEDSYAYDAIATHYGGVLAVGHQTLDQAGHNVYTVGTSPTGLFMWDDVFDWGWSERAFGVDRTNDGGYIVTGETNSFGLHSYGIFLQKLDGFGLQTGFTVFTWQGDQHGQSVRQTLDGNYIIVGYRVKTTSPDRDIVVIKTDSSGSEEWHKIYATENHDVATDVQVLPDGGYILTGTGKRSPLWHSSDVLVFRLDHNGDTLWTKYIGEEWMNESAYQIRCLPDGGYIIAGARAITTGNTDAYLVRLGPDPVTAIPSEPTNQAADFLLQQNYPNPFNPTTMINYQLAMTNHVLLTVYDRLGREITTLIDKQVPAGRHKVQWDASNLPSGLYFYRIQAGNYQEVKKMILIK